MVNPDSITDTLQSALLLYNNVLSTITEWISNARPEFFWQEYKRNHLQTAYIIYNQMHKNINHQPNLFFLFLTIPENYGQEFMLIAQEIFTYQQ